MVHHQRKHACVHGFDAFFTLCVFFSDQGQKCSFVLPWCGLPVHGTVFPAPLAPGVLSPCVCPEVVTSAAKLHAIVHLQVC